MATTVKTHRKLRLESLERRMLLDGTVLASLDPRSGVLAITGDARDNGVAISTEQINGAWHLKISGIESTWIATRKSPRGTKVNASEWVSFPAGDVKGIAIDMKDGRNSVMIDVQAGAEGGNFVLAKDFSFKSGKHLDSLAVCGLDVNGGLKVQTGPGGDTVELGSWNEANEQWRPVNVTGNATIDLGAGNNRLFMYGRVGGNLAVSTTTGADSAYLGVSVGGNLAVNMGVNQDTLSVSQVTEMMGPLNGAGIGGNATINMGDGNNFVEFNAQVAKNLTITGGKHSDYFLIGIKDDALAEVDQARIGLKEQALPPGAVVQGNLTLDSGAGQDGIMVSAVVNGKTDVKTADGEDFVGFSRSWFEGNCSINTGADRDVVDIDSAFDGNLTLDTGPGDDAIWVQETSVGGSLSITTGQGDDKVAVVGAMEGVVIQGTLTIDTGSGDDGVQVSNVAVGTPVGGQSPNAAAPGSGNVRIVTGEGGELFANPNAESDIPYLATESILIWGLQATGKLTVDGGNGDNVIAILQCSAANADVVTGSGDSLIAVGQLDLGGTGNLTVKNGPGDNGIFIGARFGWNQFFSAYEEESGGQGVEAAELAVEFGVMAASVVIDTASVYSGHVTIEDSLIDKRLAVNVKGGDVRVVIDNVQGLPIPGGFGRVGQVSIQTAAGNDQVAILPQREGDFGLKADKIAVATGGGNDAVSIDAVTLDEALVDLGAGDDLLACGDLTTIARAILDGGAGRRDIYEGPTPAAWQFRNFEVMPSP